MGIALSWLMSVFFGSCHSVTDEDGLTGTYLTTSVRPVAPAQVRADTGYSAVAAYAKSLEYSFLQFGPDGSCQHLWNATLNQGRYVPSRAEVQFQADVWQQVRWQRRLLTMTLTREVNGKPVFLQHKAYRLQFGTEEIRFSALAKAVFTHPIQPETDAQIRKRVKNSLYFYALFFRTIYTNQYNQFKPAAISMPIRYYKGGIRVPTKFDSTATWTKAYATARNAERAHEFFRRAANAVKKYPDGDNLIHEYALVLAKMADTL